MPLPKNLHRRYPVRRRTTALCDFTRNAAGWARFAGRQLLYLEVDVVPMRLMPNLLNFRGFVAIAREYDYMANYMKSPHFAPVLDRLFPHRTWAKGDLQLIGPSVLFMQVCAATCPDSAGNLTHPTLVFCADRPISCAAYRM